MKESELERILVEEVRKEGGKAYKWISPGNDGVPDRIVFFPGGEVYFIELKTESGRVSPQQVLQIGKLRAMGQQAFTIRGMRAMIAFFRIAGKKSAADRLLKRYKGGDD